MLEAYEDYYRRARHALGDSVPHPRARPIAGDMKTAEQFQKLAATLTVF